MRRPIRLMSLAALTCAGLLATAPAYAGCGYDAPTVVRPAAVVDADVDLGLGLVLGLALDVDLDLGAVAGAGTVTRGCGAPRVVRTCR